MVNDVTRSLFRKKKPTETIQDPNELAASYCESDFIWVIFIFSAKQGMSLILELCLILVTTCLTIYKVSSFHLITNL